MKLQHSEIKRCLRQLVSRLTQLGYASFYNSFFPMTNDPEKWINCREKALPEVVPCVDLFLLGRTVKISELDSQIADAARQLESIGLFTLEPDDGVRTSGFVLHPIFGIWLFYEIPNSKISLYFGQDSVALITRQMPVTGGSCLDLCSGPGVQALYAAKQGERVTSVEINPVAADLARVNAMMNDLDGRMDIRIGNLYSALDDVRFDRITANPPLLPFPEELPYAFVGHGGDDGLKITWRIVEGLSDRLTENGCAQIIGVGLGNGSEILFLPKLQDMAEKYGLDVTIDVVNHIPMHRNSSFFNSMAQTSHYYCGMELKEIEDAMERCFLRQNSDEYVVFDLFIRRGDGRVSVQDMSHRGNSILWYV